MSFSDLGVPADLVAALAQRGITEPFDVQAATIPDALAGRDVCGRAPTGSGKTIAFGVPLVARIERARPSAADRASSSPRPASSPRRSAASSSRSPRARLSVDAVYGGVGYEPQLQRCAAASTSSSPAPVASPTCIEPAATSTSTRSRSS